MPSHHGKLVDFHYLDVNPTGSPTILLIHGLGGDVETWGFQILALAAAGMRPLAVDLPGFGQTPMANGKWSLRSTTDQLAEWLDNKVPGPLVVAGHSLGGLIAQDLTFRFPEKVQKLILVSTFSRLRPKSIKTMAYLLGRGLAVLFQGTAVQAELVANHLFPDASQGEFREKLIQKISAADPRAYKSAMLNLAFFDSRKPLARLQIPTLVIIGEKDGTVSPEAQQAMAAGIPNARAVLVPEAGHAVIVDQPEIVNREMLAFLRPTDG